MVNNTLVFSCFFGKNEIAVYRAPVNGAVFFTNNINNKNEILNKGWKFYLVKKNNLFVTSDFALSSLQSKYIKFLKFLDDYEEFSVFDRFIYFDHKFEIKNYHCLKIHELIDTYKDKSIIIRKTPRKKNIFNEINISKHQRRYKQQMHITEEFVKDKIENHGYSEENQVSNTGIIIYSNIVPIKPLLDEIYNTCLSHRQPECQIYWALFSQNYLDHIEQINFLDLNPKWKTPIKQF